MLILETIAKIRRLALVQGKSIEQIDFINLDELGYLPFAQAQAKCCSI
jgi:hypothetical protein